MTDTPPGSEPDSQPEPSTDALQYPQILLEASFDSLLSHSFPPPAPASATTATATTMANDVRSGLSSAPSSRDAAGAAPPFSPPNSPAPSSLSESWTSISDAEYSRDDDTQSEVTDAGSLIDLQSTTDNQSLIDDGGAASQHEDDAGLQHGHQPANLNQSTDSRTPAASHLLGRDTWQPDPGIVLHELPESSLQSRAHAHVVDAVHTLTTFGTGDLDRLQLPASSTNTYHGTLHMSLSTQPLRHDTRNSFRLLLLGPTPEHITADLRSCLASKIGSALPASQDDDDDDDSSRAHAPPSRYHLVPDSFGPGSQPTAVELIPLAQTLELESFHSATVDQGDGQAIVLRDADTGERVVSSFDARSGEYVVLRRDWQQPHLAILLLDAKDSAQARESAFQLLVFAKRMGVPTIVLQMHNDWGTGLASFARMLPDTSARLCVEAPSSSPSLPQPPLRTLPLDLDTFLNVNPVQLRKHLAYLLSVNAVYGRHHHHHHHRRRHHPNDTYVAKAKSACQEAFARLCQSTLARLLLHVLAALALTFVLARSAILLKPSWAPTSPPALVRSLVETTPSAPSSTPASSSIPPFSHLAPALSTVTTPGALSTWTAPALKPVTLEAGRFGTSHILLRVSDLPSSLDGASVNVRRDDELLQVDTHTLFPGVFSIRLDSFQAHGKLDVCIDVSTSAQSRFAQSKSGRQECTTVDFEHQPVATRLRQAVINFDYQDLAASLRRMIDRGQDRVQQQVAALRLSLEQIAHSDRPREVMREAQERALALEKDALRDLGSRWSHLAARLSRLGDEAARNLGRAGHQSHAAIDAAYRKLDLGGKVVDRLATSQDRAKAIVHGLNKILRQRRRN